MKEPPEYLRPGDGRAQETLHALAEGATFLGPARQSQHRYAPRHAHQRYADLAQRLRSRFVNAVLDRL